MTEQLIYAKVMGWKYYLTWNVNRNLTVTEYISLGVLKDMFWASSILKNISPSTWL